MVESKESRMERYYWLKAHHICVVCGKQPAFHTYTMCPDCMERNANSCANYQAKNGAEYQAGRRVRLKRQYDQRKAAGICTKCGRRPAAPGRTKCRYCLEYDNAVHRVKSEGRAVAQARIDRRDAGLCMDCGKPAEPGYCFCEDCLVPRRAHGKKIGGHGYMGKSIEGDVRLARAKGGKQQ